MPVVIIAAVVLVLIGGLVFLGHRARRRRGDRDGQQAWVGDGTTNIADNSGASWSATDAAAAGGADFSGGGGDFGGGGASGDWGGGDSGGDSGGGDSGGGDSGGGGGDGGGGGSD